MVPFAHAESASTAVSSEYGLHHGYLMDVKEERDRRDIEMVMLPKPKHSEKPLSEVIWNQQLTREFQANYQYRFGQSLAEQVLNSQARQEDYSTHTGQSVTIYEYQKQQRAFGEYMARRLVEFHVDNWAKKDPAFAPVYALKEKVSNLNMTVKKGYKVRWKYNFAGPNMEFKLQNPYDIEAKIRYEMSGVLSAPDETIYSVGAPVTDRIYMSALHRQVDQLYQLVVSRLMTKNISMSLTGSFDSSNEGQSMKQDLYLVGLSWWD
jgi:hypothetical protein